MPKTIFYVAHQQAARSLIYSRNVIGALDEVERCMWTMPVQIAESAIGCMFGNIRRVNYPGEGTG